MTDKWTSRDVEDALVKGAKAPFGFLRNLVVAPNVSYGFGLNYEADLMVVSKARYLTEVEIKVSRSDFLADAKKWRHEYEAVNGQKAPLKAFYYAMPRDLWEKSQDVWRAPGAGVITVHREMSRWGLRYITRKVVQPGPRAGARRLTDDEVMKLMRLAAMRIWTQKARSKNRDSTAPYVAVAEES